MFHPVIIMLKRAARVVRRADEDALHFPGELLFQRLESEQIVPTDEPVVEDVPDFIRRERTQGAQRIRIFCVLCVLLRPFLHAELRMMGLVRLLQQDARLQLRPVLLADPGEFEFGFLGRHGRRGLTAKGAKITEKEDGPRRVSRRSHRHRVWLA
jgi:hypothetical protein